MISKYFQILSPVEQYLVQKKKRLFKGIDEYDDVHRLVFDTETTGLDPVVDRIILIGLKDNKGFDTSKLFLTFFLHSYVPSAFQTSTILYVNSF